MCIAAPARVIEVAEKMAVVDYNGVRTTARLDALPDRISPGDYVLVHTGFAIRRLSPEDGEETLRLFDELAASLAAESPAKPAQNAGDARSAGGEPPNSRDQAATPPASGGSSTSGRAG